MSIFGSMNNALMGITAQTKALGHISDNIANASTAGYKRVDTSFESMVLLSNHREHQPGGVTARPAYKNDLQGNLTQVSSPTSAAIQGQGFFSVSRLDAGTAGGRAAPAYYTRLGDFQLDRNRFLVNSGGFALNGWLVDAATGQLRRDAVRPIQVNAMIDTPKPTGTIDLAANLPATPKAGATIPDSTIQVFDTQGNPRTVTLSWRPDAGNRWRLAIQAPGSATQPVAGDFPGAATTLSAGASTPGVTAVAQVSSALVNGPATVAPSSVTIGGASNHYPDGTAQDAIRVGDRYSVTVNGAVVAQIGPLGTGTGPNAISAFNSFSDIAAALAAKINAQPGSPYVATVNAKDPRRIDITTADGAPVAVSGAFDNPAGPRPSTVTGPVTTANGGGAGRQQSRFTINSMAVGVGDEFRVTVAGREFKTRITPANATTFGGADSVVADLARQINAAVPSLGVTAQPGNAPNGNQLTLTTNAAGSGFTAAASVTNADPRANGVSGSSPATFSPLAITILSTAGATTAESVQIAVPSDPLHVPDQFAVRVAGADFKTTISHANINSLKDANGVVDDLVRQINRAGLGVTASRAANGSLQLNATTPNTPLNASGSKLAVTATDALRVGDKYTIRLDKVAYSVQVTADNIGTLGSYDGVANALAAQINAAQPSAPVIATVANSELRFTARTAGVPFTVDQEFSPGAATANSVIGPTVSAPTASRGEKQEFSFPQTGIDLGDRFTVTIDGKPISLDIDAKTVGNVRDISGVTRELANRINAAGLNVTAVAVDGRLTITHNTTETGRFIASATVDAAAGGNGVLTLGAPIANVKGVAQQRQITFTGAPGDKGARYSVVVNGVPVTYTTTGQETSMEDIGKRMAELINGNTTLPVTATAQGGVVTLVAKTASGASGDQFTVETDATAGKTPAHLLLQFGDTPTTVGTLVGVSGGKVGTGTAVATTSQRAGEKAGVTFTVDYGFGPQTITLNLGQIGRPGGVTQFAGSEIQVARLTQDGAARGQFKDVSYGDSGDVIVHYDNGRSRVIARMPVVTFNNPNALRRGSNGVFQEDVQSGRPNFNDPGANGAGAVVGNSREASNVDITTEFTRLIATQRSYSANTKVLTTSDEMMREVLGLVR